MLYRVLIGLHREGGRTYQTGELVFSRTDLTRLNRGGPPKFESVTSTEALEQLTTNQLREYAAQLGVTIPQRASKTALVQAITHRLQSPEGPALDSSEDNAS